ncbi:unnamed protein product [Ostreobium quekettii]|uniref:Uncharacterized protein n=1 Tax=Ostreobium quekettii TaxID=121088 RepID=A0A8S1IRZ1_9CHLO|nr:unnamed protein product [Ostreobium quekettii]
MAWSPTGKYLMTRNDNMPTTAWVWNVETMDLMAVLVHKNPVQGADWDLRSETLAICCGSTRLYLWSPSGASVVHIPLPALQASGIRWQKSGEGFILTDVDAFCIGYLTN